MTELPANLVIRKAAPRRTLLLACAAGIAAVLALCSVYELGRYDGGYDLLAAARQRSQIDGTLAKLEAANAELRKKVAELDTIRVGGAQERAELARSIGELQSQVASQAQQLAFYRGVMSPGVSRIDLQIGLKIQQLHITAGDGAGHYRVQMTLMQAARPDAAVSGTFELRVEGAAGGKPEKLDFGALTGGEVREQSFSFRYFQNLEQDIVVPSGFSPERLTVEVQAARKHVAPLIQTFPWRLDAP